VDEMKNYILITSFILLLLILSPALLAGPVIQTTFSNNPSVSSPGTDGYIQLNLINSGTSAITQITITATSVDSGIKIDPSYTSVNIGGVGASQSTSTLIKFSVPATTSSGLYRISFQIYYCQDTSCNTMSQFAIVSVQSQSQFQLKSVTPDKLNLGTNTTLTFAFVNTGSSDLNNILITWQDPTASILPVGTSNNIILSSIGAGQEIDVPVNVIASPIATPKTYPIYVNMVYYDKTGAMKIVNSTVGLIVGGTTDFSIDVQDYSNGALTLSIANIGVNPATSVSVSLPDQNGFRYTGAQSVFLGTLNPGDSTTTSFNVIVLSNQTSNLKVTMSYTDTSGLRESLDKSVAVNPHAGSGILSAFNGRRTTNNGLSQDFIYIIIIIAAVGVAYFVLRRRKKKH
jgi:hypothetical protein